MGDLRGILKALSAGSLIGIGMTAVAEWSGITRFRQGFCCGSERDILSTYVNVVWSAAMAACVGALLVLARASGTSVGTRLSSCLAAAAGAAAGLPLLVHFATASEQPYSDASMSAGPMARAYLCGIALGCLVALLVELTPARFTVTPFGIVVASAVYFVVQLCSQVFDQPLRNVPGRFGLDRAAASLGLVLLMLLGVLYGSIGAYAGNRLARVDWRRGRWWAALVGGLVGLALITFGGIELERLPAGPVLASVPASLSLVYSCVGLGIAGVLRRRDPDWRWLAVASGAGFTVLAAAYQVALAVGPDLSGDGALAAAPYDVGLGLLIALVGGAIIGSLPQLAVWSRDRGQVT